METKKNHWLHDDDFENDLYEISEFCTSAPPSPIKLKPEPSVHMQKARGKASIYEETYDNEESMAPPTPKGRGVSLMWKEKSLTPGSEFLQRQKETSNDIRMSSSGYEYCNDQIERMLNVNSTTPDVMLRDKVKLNAPSTSGNRSQFNDKIPPPALYDIIRQNVPKPSFDRGNKDELCFDRGNNDKCPNINSQKEFPKL